MKIENVRRILVNRRAVLALVVPIFLASLIHAYTLSPVIGRPQNSVQGKFGDLKPMKPDYTATIIADRRVFATQAMNFEASFKASGAFRYTNGPFYVVSVENRYAFPLLQTGNYRPGYFNESGNFTSGWRLDTPPFGGQGRFLFSRVPSAFFTDSVGSFAPNASGKFKATAFAPGAQATELRTQLVGVLPGEPGYDAASPPVLVATVMPMIDPAYSVINIRFNNVLDGSGRQVAVDISFNVRRYISPPPTGKVEVFNSAGQFVKTASSSVQEGINSVPWNLTNNNGAAMPNGVYLVKITATGGGTSASGSRGGLTVQR